MGLEFANMGGENLMSNTEMEHVIGIDLGGTSIKYALVDARGDLRFEGKLPSKATVSAEAVMEQLIRAATDVKSRAEAHNLKIRGIGVGTPGIVDPTGRRVLGGAENIVGWENIDIASMLEECTGLAVKVGNDANLMGLGETRYGAGRGCTDVVFLTVGTGIGGAIIIDGKLYGGYANRGTELGHVPLIATGERCACGATGCLEHYASTAALVRRYVQMSIEQGTTPGPETNGEQVVQLYLAGDTLATACMEEHFYYLGRGIAGFVNIFSPQRVVVGGGVAESGSFYIEKLREVVCAHTIADCALNTEIVAAQLGNRAGLVGAASLLMEATGAIGTGMC